MPPRFLRHGLRLRVVLPLCCALCALLPALSVHAQSPAPDNKQSSPPLPGATSASVSPMAKAPAAQPAAPAPGKAPASGPQPATANTAPASPVAKASPSSPPAPKPSGAAAPVPIPHSLAPHSFAKKEPTATPAQPTAPPALKPSIAAAALSPAEEVKRTFNDKIAPFIKTYCFECHGDRRMKGGVNFAPALKNPADPAHTRRWKMGLATVNAHDMPPDEADKQPTDAEREEFMAWVGRLKFLSSKDPGAFVIRRLTKTEYGNTLHDLLGVSPDIVKELPDEVPGEGYLNTLSPLQMEQYLGIANEAVTRALGPPGAPPTAVQQRLLGPAPAPGSDVRAAARATARTLARSAYRRPPTEAELDVLLRVFDLATRARLAYPEALRLMLKATLVSPQFLYITPAAVADSSSTSTSTSTSTSNSSSKSTTATPPPAEIVPLDDWMLASRLSYLLWASMPDEELSALADQGKLRDPAVLQAQVARMLKDARARALFDGFGAQWLGLADLADKTFDTTKFPQMTPALRQAMYDEARLLFDSIVRENRPVTTFITADYTFLNEPLAAIYGLGANSGAGAKPPAGANTPAEAKSPSSSSSTSDSSSPNLAANSSAATNSVTSSGTNSGTNSGANSGTNSPPTNSTATSSSPHSIAPHSFAKKEPSTPPPANNSLTANSAATTPVSLTGSKLRRVKLSDPNRGGILGMPGILAVTSFPNRTSPVKRGVWVLEQILGQHVPPAPPNVPTLEKQDKKKIANLTLRQRTELHRTNVVCANCHKILDPIGFGLENFDAIGRWRAQDDTGGPIDAAGELPGGKHFTTPAELKAIIAARQSELSRNLTEKLLAYALCRQLEGYDEIIIDQLMQGIAQNGHRLQPLITAVVTSYPFLNRRIVETLGGTAVPAATKATAPAAKAAAPKPGAATAGKR